MFGFSPVSWGGRATFNLAAMSRMDRGKEADGDTRGGESNSYQTVIIIWWRWENTDQSGGHGNAEETLSFVQRASPRSEPAGDLGRKDPHSLQHRPRLG